MAAATSTPISREVRFKSLEAQYSVTQIPKIPVMLRETKDFAKYFNPRVVSIGPYHHGTDKLKEAETLKLQFTNHFINSEEKVKEVYDEFLGEIKTLRDCYDEEATKEYGDETLAWMLFVDGCSILHYIEHYVKGKLNDLKIRDHHAAFVHQDLFLLENQLPYQVLEKLMIAKYKDYDKGKKLIEEFILKNIVTPKIPEKPPKLEKPTHLLDLLRKGFISRCGGNVQTSVQASGDQESDWESFRNIAELTAVGITLKASQANCLMAVSFEPARFFRAHLKLPPIMVDDSTGPKFMNLIAYEMSPGVSGNLEITSYICFLDSLIDHADDVKQLRKDRILFNSLGSDEEVAKVFNKIGTDLVPNSDIYKDVKKKIQTHYNKRYQTWMTQVYHEHFSSPWTIIAFLGAVLAILIAVVQTVFTIIGPLPGPCEGLCKKLIKGLKRRPYI